MSDSLQEWTADYIDCQPRIVQWEADMEILPYKDLPINVSIYKEPFPALICCML